MRLLLDTHVLLWLFDEHKNAGGIKKPALVVCPKSVLDVWYSEAGKFAPNLRVKILKNRDDIDVPHIQNNIDILVLNYAQLRVCGEELNGIKWLTTILDEGHRNLTSLIYFNRNIRGITAIGTPFVNGSQHIRFSRNF